MKFKPFRHPFRFFRILRFVWKARKPSTVHDMPAVVDTFWLKSGYDALTFFGTILTHSQQEADHMNRRFDELKNHEMIHLKQAISTGDSWWRFYCLYLRYYLQGHRARKKYPDRESNSELSFRRALLYPFNYQGNDKWVQRYGKKGKQPNYLAAFCLLAITESRMESSKTPKMTANDQGVGISICGMFSSMPKRRPRALT